jgi:hypothetical protein
MRPPGPIRPGLTEAVADADRAFALLQTGQIGAMPQ